MSDSISQEEIDALLHSGSLGASAPEPAAEAGGGAALPDQTLLSDMEKDALGEIGNISMGSAATTMSVLLGHKVSITTPRVSLYTLGMIKEDYPLPYLIVEVGCTVGIAGDNILAIQAEDAKIIADLMMGGDGQNPGEELTDLHMSAVAEAMNQMMGSVATSLSTLFSKKVDISPPQVNMIDFGSEAKITEIINPEETVVKISFNMEVEGLINSEIMQILPVPIAKEMVDSLMNPQPADLEPPAPEPPAPPAPPAAPEAPAPAAPAAAPPPMMAPQPDMMQPQMMPQQQMMQPQMMPQQPMMQPQMMPQQPMMQPQMMMPQQPMYGQTHIATGVPAAQAQFMPLSTTPVQVNDANIGLILDVPLQVTVELGRTKKTIKDILELSSGSIIELDKLAGEPVDIFVNGKFLAKGEVVVIDENFGVRITDIVSPAERAASLK
ncbi:MAG: flagellar motor switch phosphatase FliY [Schwartzia sp.]|nr:flagellar motor switch phosphatase FliY [Schwartzia sp. (in: firmicutes)]